MKNRFRSQHRSRQPGDQDLSPTPLGILSTGETGIVSHLEGEKALIIRLASLGFTLGAQVTVLHNYGQGPMIVSLLGAHIALGRQEAGLIKVQPL
jgi:Fe2+ transport system protein FeoA